MSDKKFSYFFQVLISKKNIPEVFFFFLSLKFFHLESKKVVRGESSYQKNFFVPNGSTWTKNTFGGKKCDFRMFLQFP